MSDFIISSSENKALAKTRVFSFVEGALKAKISEDKFAFCYALFPKLFINKKKTNALEKELGLYESPINNNRSYDNEFNDDKALVKAILEYKKNSTNKDMIFVYPKYSITDDMMPDIVKDMGYKLERNIIPVKMLWDEEKQTVIAYNLNNKKWFNPFVSGEFDPFNSFTTAYVDYGKHKIGINDYLVMLSPKDYEAAQKGLKKLKHLKKHLTACEAGRDLSLAFCLNKFVLNIEKEREFHITHELHHIINNTLLELRDAKEGIGKISLEDNYRLAMHNEISANMSEVFKAVEKYQRSGNYKSLAAFSSSRYEWLRTELKKTPIKDRKPLVNNVDYLILRNAMQWGKQYAKSYIGKKNKKEFNQFGQCLDSTIKEGRVLSFGNDKEEYLKQRNLMYQFKIYNPETKTCEYKDVSDKVIELTIPESDFGLILTPLSKKLAKKQQKLANMGIDDDLVSVLRQKFKSKNDDEIKKFEQIYLSKYMQNIR